ncbi:MAG: hypothetical protein R2751_11555 [Bacteroidales bacterium]
MKPLLLLALMILASCRSGPDSSVAAVETPRRESPRSAPESRSALPGEKDADPLVLALQEFNRKCPHMVDPDTRLDSASLSDEGAFRLHYTLVGYRRSQVDINGLKTYLEPRIAENVRTNPDFEVQRNRNVPLEFWYNDREGKHVLYLVVHDELTRSGRRLMERISLSSKPTLRTA